MLRMSAVIKAPFLSKGLFSSSLRVEEHPYEGDEEQCIASIGDWYAVWIGIDSEHASLAVFIVR